MNRRPRFMPKVAAYWRSLSAGDIASLALLAFALALLLPALKIGVDRPTGYEAAIMAGKDSLSFLFNIRRDDYTQACLIGTLANVLFVLSWGLWWWPRLLMAACAICGALMLYVLLPLTDAGLFAGLHVGYLLWLASGMLLGMAGWRKRRNSPGAPDQR